VNHVLADEFEAIASSLRGNPQFFGPRLFAEVVNDLGYNEGLFEAWCKDNHRSLESAAHRLVAMLEFIVERHGKHRDW
jgi:hypothetical protein